MFKDFSDFKNKLMGKRVGILGLGVSNLPLLKLLLANGITDITIRDKNPDPALKEEAPDAHWITGEDYLKDITEDYIFRSPGIMPTLPELQQAVANGVQMTSEMEAFFDLCPAKIIGITGSDGKTTTTTLIYEILKKAGYTCHLGGNIGHPLLSDLENIKDDHIVIVELSSFQLMTMKKSADIAVITNLAPNHLDKHTDMAEYCNAKKNIFQFGATQTVFNLENDITKEFIREDSLSFSLKQPVDKGAYLQDDILYFNGTEVMKRSDIVLPGIHNVDNYLAAICAVSTLCDLSYVKEVATTFGGVEHRIEFVRELDGVRYYNDSIASSPSRAIAGLRSFRQKIIVIAGGSDKNIPFDTYAKEVCQRVKYLIVMGHTKEKIKSAVLQEQPDFPIFEACDLADAVRLAREQATAGDVVMLSPACASFDYFKNFMERGNLFKEYVNRL
ncbi:MAG: UDP-N-acetylmuramoyl-L-alanine--D-glutamate ligase [Clostridia bacterium]|nr:UDP-N-acetylmuramoyl-L-alanine--D-glutamate ligase [Clostridia bacterium]